MYSAPGNCGMQIFNRWPENDDDINSCVLFIFNKDVEIDKEDIEKRFENYSYIEHKVIELEDENLLFVNLDIGRRDYSEVK